MRGGRRRRGGVARGGGVSGGGGTRTSSVAAVHGLSSVAQWLAAGARRQGSSVAGGLRREMAGAAVDFGSLTAFFVNLAPPGVEKFRGPRSGYK